MSFVIISLIFRPSSKPAAVSRRTIASNASQQTTAYDGKKFENDRRTVSFVESETTETSDGNAGGLVLQASETDEGTLSSQSNHEEIETGGVDGLPLPTTPIKRNSGKAGGKIMQKSPAPSMMIRRRSSAERHDTSSADEAREAGLREAMGDEAGDDSFEDSVTASGTETGTDKD
jgi:hypothetical protein